MSAHEIGRRSALRLLGLTAIGLGMDSTKNAAAVQKPAVTAVDHLLLGTSDLDRGIAWVQERTGIKPVVGGSHPGRGTRNALLSLGGREYLEVIAPDPAQKTYSFQLDIRSLETPRLITWAAFAPDLDSVARTARAAGLQVFGPSDGSRVRPDGKVLKWRSMGVQSTFGDGTVDPVPFFIQWAEDSVHPAQDSPQGCELKSLEFAHPTPDPLVRVFSLLAIDGQVTQGRAPALRATISTPKGPVELS
jgi:Glyoxalase-like domain